MFKKKKNYVQKIESRLSGLLVAEFGGTLSLFLGFSFMTIWDGLKMGTQAVRRIRGLETFITPSGWLQQRGGGEEEEEEEGKKE